MPKHNVTLIQLPGEKPDCCATCPLCGKIPQTATFRSMRPKGSKETHICLGTMDAMTGRGINVKASEKDSHHPLHRWCDSRWEAWMKLPGRRLGVSTEAFNAFRITYEQSLELTIKFHR